VSLLAKFLLQPAGPVTPRPPIDAVFGRTDVAHPDPGFSVPGKAVGESRDLHRILELPRRPRPDLEPIRDELTRRLGKGEVKCRCESHYKRICPKRLQGVQAWALHEAAETQGILGPIGVGEGKTLLDLLVPMVMPNCKVAVLLIPPSLREQLLGVDWEFYEQHWNLPNRAGGRWFRRGVPMLHVVAFSELSSAKSTALLEQIKPDLVIADEGHNLRRRSAARTKRFLRYFHEHPETRLCVWSGTLTSRSLTDFAHLSALSLREGSPTPLHWPTVEEWAGALDPSDFPSPIGALRKLCSPGERARDGFRRRLVDTPGVISSPDTGSCEASLTFYERKVTLPKKLEGLIRDLESSWTRPDGEELVEALAVARCARELASGFFYRWRWPRGEPVEVIDRWLAARKAWHRELREKLKHSRPHLDSPLLCAKAAIRYFSGYKGELPTWASQAWQEWAEVRTSAKPETEAVWVDDFLVRDAAEFVHAETAIVWYEHDAFGRKVAALSECPFYGPGDEASREIIQEDGSRSVVASIRAHGTGKNLQPFHTQLVANPPSDGAAWEQLIGRTHRPGQLADEVSVYVYRHSGAMRDALDRARSLSDYSTGMLGGSSKLLRASYSFPM
jgi:hypothetical protein